MEFLHLLWKFHGYICNGLGEKWIWKLPPEILPVDWCVKLESAKNIFNCLQEQDDLSAI